jgi:hypothetical protein
MRIRILLLSVADPGCLSRILILFLPDLGSRIPEPKKPTKEMGDKKISCSSFFCSHKYHKNFFTNIFEPVEKKILINLQRIIELCTQKLSLSSQKQRFGIWDPEKVFPDPGSKKPRIRNTAAPHHSGTNLRTLVYRTSRAPFFRASTLPF